MTFPSYLPRAIWTSLPDGRLTQVWTWPSHDVDLTDLVVAECESRIDEIAIEAMVGAVAPTTIRD